jgi:hypothetical protein
MRSSYDGDHPVPPAPTPIYDELYSEYRRLFRALPGDRSGEEELRFTGFAGRPYESHAGYPPPASAEPYAGLSAQPPFAAFTGQLPGAPHFAAPPQQSQAPQSPQPYPPHPTAHPAPSAAPHQSHIQQGHAQQSTPQQSAPQNALQQGHPQQSPQQSLPQSPQQNPPQGPQPPSPPQPQPATGQGWVAAGYLQPATLPAPGRHRSNLLSLPPGRS